jgi:hypothetical protein
MWEITIACHDGARLRFSERKDPAPQKGDIVETLDAGQIIKARIDACREEKVSGSRPRPKSKKSTDVTPSLLPGRDKIEEQRLTDKIYVDATRPATLNDGAGVQTDCPTVGEAVTAWHRLRPEQKIRATIKVIGGPVYTACQIDRLHEGPKPA